MGRYGSLVKRKRATLNLVVATGLAILLGAWTGVVVAPDPAAGGPVSSPVRPSPADRGAIGTGPLRASRPVLDFTVASFNALGDSHTAPGGNKAWMADGRLRARWATRLLRLHDVDVVGFQELQTPQLATFDRLTGETWDVYPDDSLGWRGTDNSLAWRTAVWQPVSRATVAVPYFDGHLRPMPYVLLRNRATGVRAWFVNVHNPADTRRFGRQEHWRARATAVEIALVQRLSATGDPVVLTGDMNARAAYLCAISTATSLRAARGVDGCGARGVGIDWIFGSPGVTFTGYTEDRGALVRRTTDHPVVVAEARVQGPAHR